MKFYPLTFNPIFKDRIWGGTKLKSYLNKDIPSNITGESWELSTVENDISIVADGAFKKKSLLEIIESYPKEILGQKVYKKYGKKFPLLFKYIDAKTDLSIQVHPNDVLAKERHNSFGKTEMWYVMQADEGARIVVGFQKNSNAKAFQEHLKNNTIQDLLREIPVKKGDVFFLETGTIHAIGGGIVLAEIQQTSDITYRVYDWNRVDEKGNSRELHVDLALDTINFGAFETQKKYQSLVNQTNNIVSCPYFKTNIIPLDGQISIYKSKEYFVVYMCVEGQFEIVHQNETFTFQKGQTILVPATLCDFSLLGKATLLEITL